jgi:homogentisate phytyltransferase/homogentisate geranylgeranyltransferase
MKQLRNFLYFSRPHTIVGTTLSITALFIIAFYRNAAEMDLRLYLASLVACLGANVYIVGLNQLTDIEIDRINKPYLPLASGAYTVRMARTIIAVAVLISLVLAVLTGPYLLLTVLLSLVLGTAYSLPPLRLKRFHFWAAFCIIAVRGLIVNLLLYLHFQTSLGGAARIPAVIWLLTGIIFVYSIVIAWFKDIPDQEGDEVHAIRTLSLRLGPRTVWLTGSILLSAGLLAVAALAWNGAVVPQLGILVGAHLGLLVLFWIANLRLRLADNRAVARYYQFVWVMFFVEYLAFTISSIP